MDAPLYDVYLTGKLAEDVSPELAAQRLAALFKSTPAAMSGLITGKTQLLKRGVDKNTALKYRDTLQAAGCEITFKAQTIAPAAALSAPIDTVGATSTPAPATATATATQNTGLELVPAGGDLLRAEERIPVVAATIDTQHLSIAPLGPLPAIAAAIVAAPDINHLSVAAAGGNLVDESERTAIPAIVPDISALTLAVVGAPIETLKNGAAAVQPDISQLQLAPAGTDLLTPEQRNRAQPAAPNTDHIKLAP